MKKIVDIIADKQQTFSFELFPAKTAQGHQKLLTTIGELCGLKPDFISCTYGAGGGSREKTFDIVQHIEKNYPVTGLAHLTCVLHSKEEIRKILIDIQSRGIRNILALRGDPPKEMPNWKPTDENFKYSSELCAFIRKNFGDYFCIGVAGFPEGHVLCQDREQDAQYLKMKVENGADFVMTQLFFNNNDYFEYAARLKQLNVRVPIIPGILPITDYPALVRFTSLCGATIPNEVKEIFEPIAHDPQAVLQGGIRFATQQCQDLLKRGAPGLHFYCLNKLNPTAEILSRVKS